jgi:hypothetical protein
MERAAAVRERAAVRAAVVRARAVPWDMARS